MSSATRTKPEPGERLKGLRIARGMSQEGAAQASGVTRGTIQQLENGMSAPLSVKAGTIIGLAEAFGVPEQDVLDILAGR